ncbi:MAG: hypothetical protein L0Y39_08245 [Methylococcaceae bacterium]|nr:hypothetical protein [Methylococcaceae bacterium]
MLNLPRFHSLDREIILSGPHDANPDDALARWMLRTGRSAPRLFVYLARFGGLSETVK